MIGQTITHYRITEKIGEGGMGVVYRAEDTHLHCSRALKFLPTTVTPDSPEHVRLVNEARALAALEHNNICPVQEIGEHNGQTFIVMSYLEGRTLKDRMAEGPIPLDEALEISRQISAGLAAAHAKGIVHRDVKPDNVMLIEAGGDTQSGLRAVLMDFGIAKNIDTTLITRTGTVMGTAAYMSPEQARGEKVESASDVWALGVLLYEMLAGKRPFQGDVEPALLYAIVNMDPEPLEGVDQEVPESVERVIGKALAKDKANRYADAGELLVDLDRAILGEEVKGRRLARRRRGPMVGAAAMLLGLVLIVLFVWPGFLVSDSAISALAVLPFENLSGTVAQDYFADGMTEALINELGQLSELTVISRTSVMQFKESKETIPEIARKLNVDAVVEASVLRGGDEVTITARLIRANPERQLWADSFDRDGRNAMKIPALVARAVADQIDVAMTAEEMDRFAIERTVDPEAHDIYLRGLYAYNKYDFREAIRYFREALDIEHTYALAYVGLANCYNMLDLFGEASREETVPKARAAAERALGLDPSLGGAYSALGWIKYVEGDWPGAAKDLSRGVELSPNDPEVHINYDAFLLTMGRYDEAIAMAERAVVLDPLTPNITSHLAWVYFYARQGDDVLRVARQLTEGTNGESQFWTACGYLLKGMNSEAIVALDSARTTERPSTEINLTWTGYIYGLAGATDKAQAYLDSLLARSSREHVSNFHIAWVYAGMDKPDEMFEYLDKGNLDGLGGSPFLLLDLGRYRDDPRFIERARLVGFPLDDVIGLYRPLDYGIDR